MTKLELNGIRKRYSDVDAVRDFDLAVDESELVSFLGPSGCGKSTTLRLIAGLLSPDEGEITIDGRVVSSASHGVAVPPDKRDIGLVFQSYALWPHMTVARNIAYGLRARKTPRSEIKERTANALRIVRMQNYADRYPAELSGGQQQRVALARALVYDPKVLLLDEPLSNLDAKLREEMRIETRELQQRLGFTAIYVTHDQSEAMAISDRIVVMHEGRIHQVGTPVEVYERPATAFAASFIGSSTIVPGVAAAPASPGETVEVKLGDTSLWGRAVQSMEAGRAVATCLRAEAVELREPGSVEDTLPRGIVQTASYQGDSWHYLVQIFDTRVQVRTGARVQFDAGDEVAVVVGADDCIVAAATDGEPLSAATSAGAT